MKLTQGRGWSSAGDSARHENEMGILNSTDGGPTTFYPITACGSGATGASGFTPMNARWDAAEKANGATNS
ncbi:hypothetical protein KIF59_01700 [Enterobacter cloacae subsp. cloacae]|nr:hypothetical protein [Enterobacter cloacae subsp. cloacae]